jgi:hypothetical protein
MMKRAAVVLLGAATMLVATSAAAEEPSGSFTLPTTVIYGRVPKPSVVVEVAKAKPKLTLSDLSDPRVENIVRAARKDPF